MTEETRPHKFFFGHASEDKTVVEQIAARVSQRLGASVWIDKYEIVAGQSLIATISDAIDEADHFCVFISPRSVHSPG